MQNFKFHAYTEILFGKGEISHLPQVIVSHGKNVLLAYGGGSIKRNGIYDNIKELLKASENNFEDMKVLTKNGNVEDLDVERLNSSSQDSSEYKKNISEILIFIKQNSNNEEKQKDTLKFIEENKNNEYTVSIEYDDNGLTRIIRAKIQED